MFRGMTEAREPRDGEIPDWWEKHAQWWTDPKTGQRVRFEVEFQTDWESGTRAEPRSIKLDVEPETGDFITAELMRRIPFGTLIEAERQRWRALALERAGDETQTLESRGYAARFADELGPRRGRALGHDKLREVANIYRAAFDDGDPVVEAVAAAFHISKSAAGKRIGAARREGFLRAAVGPKAGEQPIKRKGGKR
jgi:hypothetical protein